MWEADAEDTRARYARRWKQYGYDARSLGWNKGCQWVRFAAAMEGVLESDSDSVLDVGCGFGDLLVFLRSRGWKGRYCGVDLVPELIGEARARHAADAGAEFHCGDICQSPQSEKWDIAVAIGMFNHKLRHESAAFLAAVFDAMWQATAKAVVCDFLSSTAQPERRQPNLFYAEPSEMYSFAGRYSRRVMIHHAYMPFEFQLKVWHDDSYSNEVPVFRTFAHLAAVLRPESPPAEES